MPDVCNISGASFLDLTVVFFFCGGLCVTTQGTYPVDDATGQGTPPHSLGRRFNERTSAKILLEKLISLLIKKGCLEKAMCAFFVQQWSTVEPPD